MPAKGEGKDNPHSRHEKRRGENQAYSTSEAIIVLRDELAKQANANREQPERKSKPNWVAIATLFLVIATVCLLVVQDLILNHSDVTFERTLINQRDSSERQLRAYAYVKPPPEGIKGIVANQTPYGVVAIRNSGQTPATDCG